MKVGSIRIKRSLVPTSTSLSLRKALGPNTEIRGSFNVLKGKNGTIIDISMQQPVRGKLRLHRLKADDVDILGPSDIEVLELLVDELNVNHPSLNSTTIADRLLGYEKTVKQKKERPVLPPANPIPQPAPMPWWKFQF